MNVEWIGQVCAISDVPLGGLFGFAHPRLGAQWAIRVLQQSHTGETRKGLVCLTYGYDHCAESPSFFELNAFNTRMVSYVPDAILRPSTARRHLWLDYRFIDNVEPGLIVRDKERTYLAVAF